MTPQSKYEQARDAEAENFRLASNAKHGFINGADWGRAYEQKLNADLLTDCKAMREALESAFIALKNGCETEEDKLGLISELNHLIKTKGKV